MAIDFQSLINPNPPYEFSLMWPSVTFFAIAIVAAVAMPFLPMKPWQNRLRQRLVVPLWVLGLTGFTLLFARYQSISYLAMPLLLTLLLLVSLLWIGYSLRVALKETKTAKIDYEEKLRFERYLPRKKR